MKLGEYFTQDQNDNSKWVTCTECEWEGELSECDSDTEPDAFRGTDRKYPICPRCGGGIE